MANLQVATVTAEAPKVTNPEAVRKLLRDEYTLSLNFELEGFDEDQLNIWGYDTFSAYSHDKNGDIMEEMGDELLYRLSKYIRDGEQLTLRTGGFMKCRSVCAHQWTVYPDLVVYSDTTAGGMVVTPPDTLVDVMSGEDLKGLGEFDAIPTDTVGKFGIGPGLPSHRQKYPDEVLDAVREDDRIEEVDSDDDVWEFDNGDSSWRGNAWEVRAFASAFNAISEA